MDFYLSRYYPYRDECRTKKTQKGITFSIPYGSKGIDITLNKYSYFKKIVYGSYTIVDDSTTGKVDFLVSKKGKLLIGQPENFHGTKNWKIERS